MNIAIWVRAQILMDEKMENLVGYTKNDFCRGCINLDKNCDH